MLNSKEFREKCFAAAHKSKSQLSEHITTPQRYGFDFILDFSDFQYNNTVIMIGGFIDVDAV